MLAERESLLLRGVLDLCVLSLIAAGPRYGYEISAQLNGLGLPAASGSIYPLIARLERDGLVSATRQPSPNGPPRKWWSLTASGRLTLAEGRATWQTMSASITSILEDAATTTETVSS